MDNLTTKKLLIEVLTIYGAINKVYWQVGMDPLNYLPQHVLFHTAV